MYMTDDICKRYGIDPNAKSIIGNTYGKSFSIDRKSQLPFEEVEIENPLNLQDEIEKGNVPLREKDPSKFDTYTASNGSGTPLSFNLYDLPEDWLAHRSTYFGSEPVPKDPNIIDNSGMVGGTTKPIDPDPTSNYLGYERETHANSLHRYVFTADFDFLYKSAEEYAKIEDYQSYKYDPTESTVFINSLFDFLYDGKYNDRFLEEKSAEIEAWERFASETNATPSESMSWTNADGDSISVITSAGTQYIPPEERTVSEWERVQNDLQAVARELAERMKTGESTDLESLETTVTIKGAQFTMAELKELQELSKVFESFSPVSGLNQYDYAALGIAKTMGSLIADKYADKSEEFASALESAFHTAVDYQFRNFQRNDTSNEYATFNIHRANTGATVTDMFSSLDTSSREALEQSYQEKREQFADLLTGYTSYMGVGSASKGENLAQTDANFQKLLDAIYS